MNTGFGLFLSPDRQVACDCDERLHVPVGIDPSGHNHRVTNCLRCGRVSYTEAGVDEPRAGDIRCYGHTVLALPDSVWPWLEAWPRLLIYDWRQFTCLPAAARCESAEALDVLRAEVFAAQCGLTRAARVRAAGLPSAPPPDDLPQPLETFAVCWRAAQLTPESDLDRLLAWADPRFFVSLFALDALLRRPDLPALLPQIARSPKQEMRSVAWALANEDHRQISAVLPLLTEWLLQVPLDRSVDFPNRIRAAREVEEVLQHLLDWQVQPALVVPTLREASARIGPRDFELVRRFTVVIRELSGEPPLPITRTPWFLD